MVDRKIKSEIKDKMTDEIYNFAYIIIYIMGFHNCHVLIYIVIREVVWIVNDREHQEFVKQGGIWRRNQFLNQGEFMFGIH